MGDAGTQRYCRPSENGKGGRRTGTAAQHPQPRAGPENSIALVICGLGQWQANDKA